MDPKLIGKQMIEYTKTGFDNTFNAMSELMDQIEKAVGVFLSQYPWFPEDGKRAINEWVKAYRKGWDNYRDVVEDNFKKVEKFLSGLEKSGK